MLGAEPAQREQTLAGMACPSQSMLSARCVTVVVNVLWCIWHLETVGAAFGLWPSGRLEVEPFGKVPNPPAQLSDWH